MAGARAPQSVSPSASSRLRRSRSAPQVVACAAPDAARSLATGHAIAVSRWLIAAVLADLNLIAASAPPGAYGNADQAIAINALRTGLTMNGGTSTFDAAANALVSQVGYDVQTANANAGHQADMTTYLENYRESVSGVSLDEEMVNLVKFEAAYNAAAKMVSMADEMLDSLMNMVR